MGKEAVGKGSPEFLKLLDEIRQLHLTKGHDYGNDGDPLANMHSAEDFGVEPWRYSIVRLNEKVTRLKAFCKKGILAHDSVENDLKDIASHAILSLVLFRETENAP